MRRFHVKKGEEAVIIAGADKGKRGRIITVIAKKQRVIIEGAHMIKKHMRKSQQYPQGQIIEREGSVHISNVMRAEEYDARAARHAAPAPAPAQA
jgi:large subunit ribosomal protein L24